MGIEMINDGEEVCLHSRDAPFLTETEECSDLSS